VIGQPQRGRDREQRPVLERLVAAADIGRRRELHVLARQQHLHRAGLEAGDGGAVGIGLGLAHHRLFRRGLGDEAREHRRGLLPVELGVVVLVEQEQPHHRRRDMRQPPDLAGVDRPVDVQHVLGRHAHRLRDHRALIGAVAGMAAAEVVGHAPADRVELDPAADAVAVRRRLGLLEGQHLGLQQLQLQRHQQPVLGPARAQPHEALAGDEHLARDHGLQAVEVGQPVGIGLVGPGEPEPLDPVAHAASSISDEGLIPSPTRFAAKASQALAA
jgi:hypothetical protein